MFGSRWGAFRVWAKFKDRAKKGVAMILFTEGETALQRDPGA